MAVIATTAQPPRRDLDRPRLVVGIVIDQMRWDYLYRYYDRFGETGFKRLINEGFNCENTMLPYIPTVTAIGHTSIYTGSVPAIHGIAGNDFYIAGRKIYCTDDSTVRTVGSTSDAGKMSPRNLRVTTIGDELRLATNFRSKVIGVSIKDRASILPAGHTANGAYWFDDKTGGFITSTYYRNDLPEWVKAFNRTDPAGKYLAHDWETLYPIDTYTQSTADDNVFEKPYVPGGSVTMPVRTSELQKQLGYGVIRNTPYGNSLVLDFAKAAIASEQLGQRGETDMLTVSLSSTDYIGHQFGVNAVETEDTYLRLDRDLGSFLASLDSIVGRGNYFVFLTADHAAAHNIEFLNTHNIPSGGWDCANATDLLNQTLSKTFNTDARLVKDVLNYQIFLDEEVIKKAGIDRSQVIDAVIDELLKQDCVAWAVDMEDAASASIPEPVRERIVNGYNRLRSGDIQVILQPGWYESEPSDVDKTGTRGTTHGVWLPYDAHIPLLFMGWNIPQGQTNRPVRMTDIAATVCALLHIQMPNGCIGKPVTEIVNAVQK